MIIRTNPPHNSMRRLKRLPQNTPIRLPKVEMTKEVKPMMTMGERMEVKEFIPTKANDMPMASASMLVAMASVTTTFSLVGSKQHLSSLLKLSLTMRPPRNASKPTKILHASELLKKISQESKPFSAK